VALGTQLRPHGEHGRVVRRHVSEGTGRGRCYARRIGWMAVDRNASRLLPELIGCLDLRARAPAGEIGEAVPMSPRSGQLRVRQR